MRTDILRTFSPAQVERLKQKLQLFRKGSPGCEDAILFYDADWKWFRTKQEEISVEGTIYKIKYGKVPKFVYAAGCVTIADLVDTFEQEAKSAVLSVCEYFASRMNGNEEKALTLAKTITRRYDMRISLFGLMHCFELVELSQPPFEDFKMYGFSVADLTRAIEMYVKKMKSEYEEYVRSTKDVGSQAANWAGMMKNAPDSIREAFEEMIEKSEKRNGQARQLTEQERMDALRWAAEGIRASRGDGDIPFD